MPQVIHQPVQAIVHSILDQSFSDLKNGQYQQGIQSLTLQLKKILDAVGSENLHSEIKQQCVEHPIAKLIFQDPCTYRSYSKPNGYAGDANLIDYLYGLDSFPLDTSYVGRKIFQANVSSSSTESVRWRAHHLSDLIEKFYEEKKRKVSVLSVASGRCRELAMVTNPEHKIERFICLDQDEGSNEIVRKNYPYPYLHVLDESIIFLLKNGLGKQEFDFIYSAGLFDYLDQRVASKLIKALYRNLREDGHMLIPNFAPGLIEQGYMETFMDWKLIYRTEDEMMELAEIAGIPEEKVNLYRDPMCNVIYMGLKG
ncbi:class I SAM-dependent methyltransferase [Saprospiraceae bacterium]|nr:class I SAM-dependent methyltransferase [Saprospiraceae bacterium]